MGKPIDYRIIPIRNAAGRIVGTYTMINGTRFYQAKDGVNILYPDGSKRWIKNDWYDNVNTDAL